MQLEEIQSQLQEQHLDGWLFFDHHLRDPIAYRVLAIDKTHVTRRWYYLIPAHGDPRKLSHRIESKMLEGLPGIENVYSSWGEQTDKVAAILAGCKRVAMQYSPLCAIPYISNIDAGTVELIRSTGVEVVSSAALVQYFEARLSQTALESHLEAGRRVDGVRAEAFDWIAGALRSGHPITEFDAAEFVRRRFQEESLLSDSGPIVAVDGHAGDPHYEPRQHGSASIQPGSFVLLDMWAKLDKPGAIFYDITWTGFCGNRVPSHIDRIFQVVKQARDAAVQRVIQAVAVGESIRGFEVDDATRSVIVQAGFGDRFVHRTGHSIGVEIHANGANMDNLETHDDREITQWSCFSIEPGIYLEDFGVRSEVDIFVDDKSARVTGEVQESVVLIN